MSETITIERHGLIKETYIFTRTRYCLHSLKAGSYLHNNTLTL